MNVYGTAPATWARGKRTPARYFRIIPDCVEAGTYRHQVNYGEKIVLIASSFSVGSIVDP
ncbi:MULTISPECIES: hypothetical protein [Paraburkholderia]|jgi:hypothetical protein|uniref:Uncharacterized protein n=1 Tax=Paraburkholderia fungorum TaxID=134537 RepID=A0AAW3V2P9_9BURK|nr:MULTISPECIES: hypothetical protein [Paraburkholderia]KFX64410.1 hypothetical protein KBK24_0122590 [Burkholderia sp. K24]MBB4515473.1 hypothetical protein [Paraburkholderia fungorum]MBB6203416.1 hypothetical protein [Paraburkholderia fungorum]PZR45117.1 MAG: hypothetical protein DI523_21725 [Paraburkholderia fungorum]USX07393.1 hypothetical protein NHH62_32885 [Paraburkholderia fungorum]